MIYKLFYNSGIAEYINQNIPALLYNSKNIRDSVRRRKRIIYAINKQGFLLSNQTFRPHEKPDSSSGFTHTIWYYPNTLLGIAKLCVHTIWLIPHYFICFLIIIWFSNASHSRDKSVFILLKRLSFTLIL